MTRTHAQNLKHLRAELEKAGVQVVGVRLNKRCGFYSATSCNFVLGGHIFDWNPNGTRVIVRKEVNGKYVEVAQTHVAE